MLKVSKELTSFLDKLDAGVDLLQKPECIKKSASLGKDLIKLSQGDLIEGALQIVLELMAVTFYLDKDFRRNIKDFDAEMVFQDKDEDFYVVAKFHKEKLTVSTEKAKNPVFILSFRDEQTLIKILFSGAPDILNAMLNQEVDFTGNINYMNKFAYMAIHILYKITGQAVYAK